MMTFDGCKLVATTPEVWAVVMIAHRDQLKVYATVSQPGGDPHGNPHKARMETAYCFENSTCPIMAACTTWDIENDHDIRRTNEKHEYWLYFPVEEPE